ncbi:MAG: hypothetical protein ACR2IE_15520 [Candidatus Sumerlaeaceae bacterium]
MVVVSNSVPHSLLKKQLYACLPFTGCCPAQLSRRVVSTYFGELENANICCTFVNEGPLAWSCWRPETRELNIHLHNVLNHGDTPAMVIEFLIKHELLHLRVAPVMVDDEPARHHDAFVQQERAISPERLVAWTWLYVAVGAHLQVRRKAERVDVANTWKATWHLSRPDLAEALRTRHRYARPAVRYI